MKGFGGGGGGMQQLMKQANQMQSKMKKLQEELATREYQGSSGGGAITVTANGDYLLTKVEIDDEVISSDDKEMLQDLVMTAANEALKTAKETSDKEMSKVTGGVNLPF